MSDGPIAARKPYTFTHHGITLEDPYAWLRDPDYPTVESPEILAYLRAENQHYDAYFEPLKDQVDEIFEELKARQPQEDESVPYLRRGYWYQWRFHDGAQYRTWYRAPQDTPEDWQVLLDERELAKDREYFRLGAISISPDTRFMAYSTDVDGSERFTMEVIDLADRSSVTTPIKDTLGGVVWGSDSKDLLYTRVSAEWRPYQVLRRALTRDVEDTLIYEEADTGFFVGLDTSATDSHAIISTASHSVSEIYLLPLDDIDALLRQVTPRRDGHEYEVDVWGERLVVRSNRRHSNFDVFMTANLTDIGEADWETIIEASDALYITGIAPFQDHMVLTTREMGLEQIRIYAQDLSMHAIDFDEAAYDVGLSINPNYDTNKLRLSYSSMVTPSTVLEYDIPSRAQTVLKTQIIPSGYTPANFRTERLLCPSRDEQLIPISLVYHKDTPRDGSAPLHLYGYGAYGAVIEPRFSTSRISLLERGFIYAIAHIRGGDDLGHHWYQQGKGMVRTNTFNDFVDCARFLIEKNLTSAGKLAISGGSAGGELMGAVVNQAPELWGAVVADVPFVDVLNTMLDASLPLTPIEWPEWGNPIEDKEAFEYILSYSPYDQLKTGRYPPMMVTAGLNDPRVTYWEPAKYVAKLRTLKTDHHPLILKTNMGAGHGGQSGRFSALREVAETYAFFLSTLGEEDRAGTR
ncbi:MAG: S9 family peptidase [Pseudomonadota bacterium]